ncbi:hypothetical protein F5Y05DRAFT_389449 [Hypoxylon sp. FL0543]|nr:hypothetical protein F5Y05DRAFT_389449 [Hypoxylon sp. FL0543]
MISTSSFYRMGLKTVHQISLILSAKSPKCLNNHTYGPKMSSVQSPSAKPPHILDFPSEIFAQIFGYLRGELPRYDHLQREDAQYFNSGPNEIKNLRLVCRRFCEESSHLLLPTVTVDICSTSLARLDKISRHPSISQGVRAVVVVLRVFSSALAHELDFEFVHHQWLELRNLVRSWRAGVEDSNIPEGEDGNLEAVTKCRRILDSWNRLAENLTARNLSDDDQRNLQLIKRVYEQYRQAYLEQERILADGSFVRAVADAVARFPFAKSLAITDCKSACTPSSQRPTRSPLIENMLNDDLLIRNLAQPMAWGLVEDPDRSISPFKLLSQIPLAIHEAGVILTDITYNIGSLNPSSGLVNNPDFRDLRIAMRQLTRFEFSLGTYVTESFGSRVSTYDAIRCIVNFIEAFIDTDSMQYMRINVGDLFGLLGKETTRGFRNLLLTRPWPHLSYVYFQGPIYFEELQEFYARIPRPAQVELVGVNFTERSLGRRT